MSFSANILSSITQPFSHENFWILDLGATHHVCFCEKKFSEIHKLQKPSTVSLPNGTAITIEFVETISILQDLVLERILFYSNI